MEAWCRRRLGQRFMVGFEGFTASADVKRLPLRDFGVGHVVLFARNVAGPRQVADLVRELQSAARDAGQGLPLLVAVDQEGGRMWRASRTVDDLAVRPCRGPGRQRGDQRAR